MENDECIPSEEIMHLYLKMVGVKTSILSPGGRCVVFLMLFYDPESDSPKLKLKGVFKQEVRSSTFL